MELAHLPNNTTFLWSKTWKFQFISCSGSKVIPILPPDSQTHRQTHILHPYLHGRDFFLYGNLYLSLHYVPLFALLTHSLCLWRIKHSNWLKLVAWLPTSNESAFLQLCFCRYAKICSWHWLRVIHDLSSHSLVRCLQSYWKNKVWNLPTYIF